MVGTVLLVVSEGFDDMSFLSNQVILEEAGNDVIATSKVAGGIKGDSSSVMTVSLSDALDQDRDYSAIILIGGGGLKEIESLGKIVKKFFDDGKYVGAIESGVPIISESGIEVEVSSDATIVKSGKCITLADPSNCEQFAEDLASLI